MICLQVMNRCALGVKSPMDRLRGGHAQAPRVTVAARTVLVRWKGKLVNRLLASGFTGCPWLHAGVGA